MAQTNKLPADKPDEEPIGTPNLDDAEKNAAEFFRRVRLAKDEGLISPNQLEETFSDLIDAGNKAARAEHGRKHDMAKADATKATETSKQTQLESFLQILSPNSPEDLGEKLRLFCVNELKMVMYPDKGAGIHIAPVELDKLGAIKVFDFGEEQDKIAIVLKKHGVWTYKALGNGKWAAQGI